MPATIGHLAGKVPRRRCSDRGAELAAEMATLIMTARLNHIDPKAWLTDVFARIADPGAVETWMRSVSLR